MKITIPFLSESNQYQEGFNNNSNLEQIIVTFADKAKFVFKR